MMELKPEKNSFASLFMTNREKLGKKKGHLRILMISKFRRTDALQSQNGMRYEVARSGMLRERPSWGTWRML